MKASEIKELKEFRGMPMDYKVNTYLFPNAMYDSELDQLDFSHCESPYSVKSLLDDYSLGAVYIPKSINKNDTRLVIFKGIGAGKGARFVVYDMPSWLLGLLKSSFYLQWVKSKATKFDKKHFKYEKFMYDEFPVPPLYKSRKDTLARLMALTNDDPESFKALDRYVDHLYLKYDNEKQENS